MIWPKFKGEGEEMRSPNKIESIGPSLKADARDHVVMRFRRR